LTRGQLIGEVARRLTAARVHFGHGTDNARDEAAFLVLRGLKLPFDADLRHEVPGGAARRIQALVRKRIVQRLPASYVLHEAWLGEHAFYVDERVIVPRSHIAELLRARLSPWLDHPARRILDLCTGSGCLAIVAAHMFPRARVDAADLSAAALAVARKNVARHRLERRVRVLRSDLFQDLGVERYDIIVTNPPYVPPAAMRALPREYRHEPRMALAGGKDGLDLVKKIIDQAPTHLAPRGLLVCEIGDNRRALERARPGVQFVWPEVSAGAGPVFLLQAPPAR
jgi:ribosomal protein L3 glutamine methyltransferase